MSLTHRILDTWQRPDPALTSEGRTLSGLELAERVARAAAWLRTRGVGAGDVVALQLPKGATFLEACLGAWAIGAAVLPLNDRYTTDEVRFTCTDAGARLAVVITPLELPLDVVEAAHLPAAFAATAPDPLTERPSLQTLAGIFYTSGTTGRPKGARLRQANLLAVLEGLHAAWGWSRDDVLVHALPLYHLHGLLVAMLGALHAGAHQIWLPRFEPAAVVDTLVGARATVFMGVPTFYVRLLQHGLPDLSHVRLFTSGSAPLPAHVQRTFAERTGHAIVERYGMSEVGIVLSNPLKGPRKPGSVGLPLPGVEVRIVDPETGAPRETGAVGELLIRGPAVFEGYHGRPEATAAALRDGWMHTGDQGHVDDDGYVHLVGRRSDLILRGGLNVYPGEVEQVLAEAPGVDEIAVFGVADPDLGEVPHAASVGAATPDDILAFARRHLAPYKVPLVVHRLDALPRNSMGKVRKTELRRRLAPVVIRDARADEARAIADRNVAMALETEELALDPEIAARGARAVFERDVGAQYLIAEVDGAPVGQLMLTREWSDWRDRWVWWIQSVYVEPDHRTRGVYRAMYESVLARARAAGVAGVRLYVDRRNTRAAAVYRRCGMDGAHYDLFEHMLDDGAPDLLYAPEPGDG